MSLATASSTVMTSLTASTQAFLCSDGVRDLDDVREEVLRGSAGGGEGARGGEEWVDDVARVPSPGPYFWLLLIGW